MNELIHALTALAMGTLLGVIFFGGLWLTVKRGVVSKRPALVFIVSFFARTAVVLLGVYYLSSGGWQDMVVSLVGFVLARVVIIRMTRKVKEGNVQLTENKL